MSSTVGTEKSKVIIGDHGADAAGHNAHPLVRLVSDSYVGHASDCHGEQSSPVPESQVAQPGASGDSDTVEPQGGASDS